MHRFKISTPLILLILSGFLAVSCASNDSKSMEVSQSTENSLESAYQTTMPEKLVNVIESMGGIERWDYYKAISYNIKTGSSEEYQIVDLKNRHLRITSAGYTIGFNGQEVWITPGLEAKKNPRFYSSLFFYFFCIPYVFNDQGVIYEDLGKKVIEGQEYDAVKISFEPGIGDADKDEYIAHFHPETQVMDWLLYTVTYHSGERKDRYNALNYSDWREVQGLKLPGKLTGYHFRNDTIGDQRYEAKFSNIFLHDERPEPEMFEMPEGAEVDSLKN